MHEVEVKILNIDQEEVEARLKELGAEKIFDGEVHSCFMTHSNTQPAENVGTIRIRQMGKRAYLTIKKKIHHDSAKIREEYEVRISSFAKTKKIFELLGYTEKVTTIKSRISYIQDNVRVEIDTHTDHHSNIPTFLEIEATDANTVYEYVQKLGFKKEDCKPWIVKDIAKHMESSQS